MKTQDRARFNGEKRYDWTVQVAGERYTILTKQAPFKPQGELVYTICDSEGAGHRGPTNFVGNGWDMQTKGPLIGSRALHAALLSGEVEISHRSRSTFDRRDLEVKP